MKPTRTLLPDPNTTRLSSVLIGAAVCVGVWLLVTVTAVFETAVVASLAGGLLGVTLLLHSTNTPAGKAVAVCFLPVAAIVGLVAVGIAARDVLAAPSVGLRPMIWSLAGQIGLAVAVGMAAFGVVGTRNREIGNGGVARLWKTAVLIWLGTTVSLGAVLIGQFDALRAVGMPAFGGLSIISKAIFRPTEPQSILLTFWLLVGLAVGSLKLLVDVAPIVELTPQTKQQRIAQAMSKINSALNWSFALLVALIALALTVSLRGIAVRRFASDFPAVFAVFSSTGLRYGLVGGICLLIGSTLLIGGLKLATGRVTQTIRALTPALAAGVGSVVVAVGSSPLVADAVTELPELSQVPLEAIVTALTPPGIVLTGLALAMGLLTGFLAVIVIAGALRYIPQQNGGSVISSGSLAVGGIIVGMDGGHSLVVFAIVAISAVVWSIGDQNATMCVELEGSPSVQLEAIQTLSTLGLAVGGVILAVALYTLVLGRLVVSDGTLVGVLTTVLGVLILIVALRG